MAVFCLVDLHFVVCMQVRDWYVESFKELRSFPRVRDAQDELKFTGLLKHIYHRHKNVVPVMAMGVAELKRDLHQVSIPQPWSFCDRQVVAE